MMKQLLKRVVLFIICLAIISGGISTEAHAAALNDALLEPGQKNEAFDGDRYDAPFAYLGSVTLVTAQTYNNGYKTYNIVLAYSANDSVSSVKISEFALTNGSSLYPITYYQSFDFYKDNLNYSSGTVTIGSVYLPASVTNVYASTSNARIYLNQSGYYSADNLYNQHVIFN